MDDHPKAKPKDVKTKFPDSNPNSIDQYIKVWRKSIKKKNKPDISSNITNSSSTKRGNSNIASLQNIKNLSPEEILFLGMTKQLPLDPQLFNIYMRKGLYDKYQEQKTDSYKYYTRPKFFNDYQDELIQIFRNGSCLIVGARQKTWKTSTGLIACLEECNERKITINFLTTSKPLATELVGKIDTDDRVNQVCSPYLLASYTEKKLFKTGSRIIPLATTRANAKGRTANILWIDELDDFFLIAGCLDVLAAAIPQVIATMMEGGKVWITCNMGETRGFHLFIEIMKKFGDLFPIYEIMEPDGTVYKERTIVRINPQESDMEYFELTQDVVDYIVHSILTLAKDKRYADAMVYNIRNVGTDPFPAALVTDAFNNWDQDLLPKYPVNVVMGIDPGFTHATGVIILSRDKSGMVYEEYAHEFFGGEITEEDFKQRIFGLYKKYGVKALYCESNSGGLQWMHEWGLRGMNCLPANFGTGQPNTGDVANMSKAYEKTWNERVLKDLLEKHMILLHDDILFNEFGKYDPNKSKDKNKGDLVDALLHAGFWIVGGAQYVYDNLIDKESIKSEREVAYLL